MTQQTPSADSFLMGGGIPAAKFPAIGTRVSGRITEEPAVQQQKDFTTGEPKFWNDGNPMMQLAVTLATDLRDGPDDDGLRRIYVKGQLKTAVADAVRRSGARGLEVGGILTVTYSHDGEASKRGFNPPKQYAAEYAPAAAAELNTPDPWATTPPVGTGPLQPQAAAAAAQVPAGQGAAVAALAQFTPEQLAAAQADPATRALLEQLHGTGGGQAADQAPPF